MYTKICKHCGREFQTNNPQKLYCDAQHYRPCPVCGKPVAMIDNDFSRKPKCCSKECAYIQRKHNFKPRICRLCGEEFLPNSGVQIICSKDHMFPCEICGKEFVRNDLNAPTTCSPQCSAELTRRHNREKYGVDHPMMLPEVRNKVQQTMLSRYGVKHALQQPEISHRQQETAIATNMLNNGVPYACMLPQCIEAQGRIVSNVNRRFGDMLKSAGIPYSFEKRVEDMSYDIYIPGMHTVVEIDPSYTHSTHPTHWGMSRDKYYHRDKTNLATRNGLRCIHVFDWDDPQKIVNMLQHNQRVYARECTIYRLNKQPTDDFLNKYHLQGTCRGQILSLGLVYQGEILQVMTFGKPRYSTKHYAELLRLASKHGVTVVGGASRLFSYATKEFGLSNIISYCDLSKFSGDVYSKIGMKLLRTTPPQEVWSKGYQKITANLLRQRGYDQIFKTAYGKGASNNDLMLKNGWLPVYDCGQSVYEYI